MMTEKQNPSPIRISVGLVSRLISNLRDPKVTNPTGYLMYPLLHPSMVLAVRPQSGTAIDASTGMASVRQALVFVASGDYLY